MNALYESCQKELPEAMKFWEEIVNIDSGSGDTAGLRQVAALIEPRLEKLGFSLTRIPAKDASSEYNLLAVRKGQGKKSVLLMAHMDTVFPAGTVAQRPFTIKGDWAHGPGVADCKVGIVTILHMLQLLEPQDFSQITVLFNCDEEIGSPSSKELVMAEAKKHDYALSYEPGGVGDGIAIARKGNAKIHIKTFGKNSHAGTDPEKGRNALTELVWQVNRMADLGDKEKQTSVVFTKIQSGDRLNVVPDSGEAWADVRVALPEELDRLEAFLHTVPSERIIPDCRVEATLLRARPAFPRNDATDKVAARAQAIYGELGKTLTGQAVGGVGDINYAYFAGATCLCRLAPPSGGPNHCAEENCHVPSLAPRMYLSVRLIKELCS